MVEWDDGDAAGQPIEHTQSSLVPLSLLRPTGFWSKRFLTSLEKADAPWSECA